jgi:hypothetical protein
MLAVSSLKSAAHFTFYYIDQYKENRKQTMMNNLKSIAMIALIVVGIAGIATAMTLDSSAKSSKGDNGSGTGCAVNSTGFNASHGKCFHPQNHNAT